MNDVGSRFPIQVILRSLFWRKYSCQQGMNSQKVLVEKLFSFLLQLHLVLTKMNILISQPFTFNIHSGCCVHYLHDIGCFSSDEGNQASFMVLSHFL